MTPENFSIRNILRDRGFDPDNVSQIRRVPDIDAYDIIMRDHAEPVRITGAEIVRTK
jgi:hypothetical protein